MKIDTNNSELLYKELGVNINKYHSEYILPAIKKLVNSPYKVVLQFTLWPLFFILSISLTGAFLIWPQSWSGGIFWMLTGFLVGPLSGISVAAYMVVRSLDETSKKLYEASLDAMDNLSSDIQNNIDKIPTNLELPTYKELLRVVKISLVFPALKDLTKKKFWILGSWIGNIVTNYLKKMSQKSEQLLENEHENTKNEDALQLQLYAEKIKQNTDLIRKNLPGSHKSATNLILAPLSFTMTMSLVLNLLIFVLIWYFFL